MIRSMTGFGTGHCSADGISVAVEISSLNGRFLDIKVKIPNNGNHVEKKIRKAIKEKCRRGNIYVVISFVFDEVINNSINKFDREKYKVYRSVLSTLNKDYGHRIEFEDVIDLKELILDDSPDDVDSETIMNAFNQALKDFLVMSRQEGEILYEDISKRLDYLSSLISPLITVCENSKSEILGKYRKKIENLLEGIEVDDARILQEAAILSEKSDVSEECVRINSHIKQFKSLLSESKPVGKRLNFLLQEMYREINTVGSKNNMLEVVRMVIDIKDEIEKIKEQVQNIL